MGALDTTKFAFALKTKYSPKALEIATYKAAQSPLYTMISKPTDFDGKNHTYGILHSQIKGRSRTFGDAQALKEGSDGQDFVLTRVRDYAIWSIMNEVILASRKNEAALASATQTEVDGATNQIGCNLARGLYGDGSGSIGTISDITSGVVTLTNIGDAINFQVGQTLVAAASSTSAIRAGIGKITAIDDDSDTAVTLTIDGGVSPSGWANGDVLFSKGDYSSASDRKAIAGLLGWIPPTSPDSTPWFGVDRSTHTLAYAGHRVQQSSLRIDEALKSLAYRLARKGGRPDACFMPFGQHERLTDVVDSKHIFTDKEVKPGLGVSGVTLITPAGSVDCLADPFCPSGYTWMLTMSTWSLMVLEQVFHFVLDARMGIPEATADAFENRIAFYGNMKCSAPMYNGVLVHS